MGKKYITDIVSIGDHSLDAAGMVQIDALIAGGLHSDAGYLKNLSDNSNYFLDLNATSRLNRLQTVSTGVNKNSNQTTKDGLSLYGAYVGGEATYGMMFTGTAGSGTHGAVTSDWATYFTMNNSNNRGWIFRRVGSGNSASISAGGAATFDTSVTSNKFYDTNNTNSWLDIRDSWGNYHLKANEGGMYFDAPVYYFRELSNSSQRLTIDAGTATATSSLRAPIFYDSNNTSYYLDPASTSNLNGLNVKGGIEATGNFLINSTHSGGNITLDYFHSSDAYSGNMVMFMSEPGITHDGGGIGNNIASNSPYYGRAINHGYGVYLRFYKTNGHFEFWNTQGNAGSAGGQGTRRFYGDASGNTFSQTSSRAPIFYDFNDTRYYLDPASTSRLKTLNVTGNVSAGGGSSPQWNAAYSWGNHANGGYLATTGKAADSNAVGGYALNRLVSGGSSRKSTQISKFADNNEVTGFYYGNNVTGAPTTDWMNYIHSAGNSWYSSNNYSFQLTHAFHSDSLWVSRTTNGVQSGARLILDSGGGTQVKSGVLQSNASLRAPTFYDSNDTNYYLNPAGTSSINGLTVNGSLDMTDDSISIDNQKGFSNSGSWTRNQTPYGYIDFGPANTSHAHIYTDRTNFYFNKYIQVSGGSRINTSDIRAKTFYDIDNTTYYTHPASTSVLNTLDLRGRFFPDATSDYDATAITSLTNAPIYFDELNVGTTNKYIPAFHMRSMHSSGYRTHMNVGLYKKASAWGDNDTGFYVALGGNDSYPTKHWKLTYGHSLYNSEGYVSTPGSFRAPIFYDSNNTGYYLNPASTSNLNALTLAGTATASNFILSSDERKKTKIKDLTRNNINANWKSFEMKNDEGEYRTGVIAQELEETHPEFVNTDPKGFKSVKYIDLLIAKIAELEARLEKLEK